jgi:mono/diheme cytochrome c family protein
MTGCASQEETMTTITRLSMGLLGTAALLGATAFAAGGQTAPAAPNTAQVVSGAQLFRTYCASCHGTTARGDGPLADAMRRRPANLTEIAKRQGGVFPKELMFRVIDGREHVRGHGGPDMPAWGDAFMRSVEGGSAETVKLRIEALVLYLETIQARDVQ